MAWETLPGSVHSDQRNRFLRGRHHHRHPRNQIKGLTTAATLWATACMGLAVGVGFYECALAMYVILIFILLLVNVVDTKYLKIPTSTALYLEVRRDVGLGNAIHFIHEIGWSVREVKEFPSGRPDILAVRLDLESEQAMRGDISTMVLLKEQRAWSVWKCDVQQSLSPHLLLTAHCERGWGLLFYVIGIAAWPHPKFPAGDMRNKRWGGLEILRENPGAEPLDSNLDSGLSAVRSESTGPPAPRSVLPLL